jgi:hypothetical protein
MLVTETLIIETIIFFDPFINFVFTYIWEKEL